MILREYELRDKNFIELLKDCPVECSNILLLDIETTGLSRVNNHIYIVGIGRISLSSDDNYVLKITQFFSESNDDESSVLSAFNDEVRPDDIIVTFNGNRFDIPFLNVRLAKYGYSQIVKDATLDLYKVVKSMSGLITLPNFKQKTVEEYLGIHRKDEFSGLELITVYKNYIKHPNEDSLSALLLHNMEDVEGMVNLFSLFTYQAKYNNYLDNVIVTVNDCKENEYTAFDGSLMKEYLIMFETNNDFPVSLSINGSNLFFRLNGTSGRISLKLFQGELCHYIEDYKNYYYLPLEDSVIHKDLAMFVDKNHREKATMENCRIKKDSSFIPAYHDEITYAGKKLPVFKENPKSKDLYIEFDDNYMKDNTFLEEYILSILFVLCKEK